MVIILEEHNVVTVPIIVLALLVGYDLGYNLVQKWDQKRRSRNGYKQGHLSSSWLKCQDPLLVSWVRGQSLVSGVQSAGSNLGRWCCSFSRRFRGLWVRTRMTVSTLCVVPSNAYYALCDQVTTQGSLLHISSLGIACSVPWVTSGTLY